MSSAVADLAAGARRRMQIGIAQREQRDIELTQAERYARDPVAWINDHVVIGSKFDEAHDEGRGVRALKMRLFDHQKRTLEAWIDLPHLNATGDLVFSNVLIEKSRQIGETWLFAAVVCWLLHYRSLTGLVMAQRGGDIADRGWTHKSFFGRVKYVDDRLRRDRVPGLGDLVYRPAASDPASIANPARGALVYGECQRDDPGRGQSLDWLIVDEAAHVQHGEMIHAALADACPNGKVYLSTVTGDDNMHARLCDDKPAGWTYLRLHWSAHPAYGRGAHVAGADDDCPLCLAVRDKVGWSATDPLTHRFPGRVTSPWYDRAVCDKTAEQVASELDIDRERSLSARVFAEFDSSRHVVAGGLSYMPEAPLELAVDYGLDVCSVLVIQQLERFVRVIGILEMGDVFGSTATPDKVAAALRLYLQELGVPHEETLPDRTPKIRAIGCPSGHHRQQNTAKPMVDDYRRQGFTIGRPASTLTARIETTHVAVKRLLDGAPKELQVCGIHAAEFASHMRNNVWPTDVTGSRRTSATEPNDNVHNHACRAFAYWCVDRFPPSPGKPGGRRPRGRVPAVAGLPGAGRPLG